MAKNPLIPSIPEHMRPIPLMETVRKAGGVVLGMLSRGREPKENPQAFVDEELKKIAAALNLPSGIDRPELLEWLTCAICVVSEAIYIIDPETGNILYIGPQSLDISGHSNDYFINERFLNFITDDTQHADVASAFENMVKTSEASESMFSIANAEGEIRWVKVSGTLITLNNKSVIIGSASDITEEINRRDKDIYRRTHDRLTGLLNRDGYFEHIGKIIDEQPCQTVSFIFIDLDGFKEVNDRYGHIAGDNVLVEFAKIINDKIQDYPYMKPVRFGGDEFGIIIQCDNNAVDIHDITSLINEIKTDAKAISSVCDVNGNPIQISGIDFSVGYATGVIKDIEQIYAHADREMYRDKNARRDKKRKRAKTIGGIATGHSRIPRRLRRTI